jgi:ElaB/YqjD/DUF883 family membrane-anchored ribosome-binding protein
MIMASTATNPETLKKVARDALNSAEEKTVETIEAAREKAEQVVDKAADKAQKLESDISNSVSELSGTVTRYINEKPLQAAGIAFAAGVLATLILRKR